MTSPQACVGQQLCVRGQRGGVGALNSVAVQILPGKQKGGGGVHAGCLERLPGEAELYGRGVTWA